MECSNALLLLACLSCVTLSCGAPTRARDQWSEISQAAQAADAISIFLTKPIHCVQWSPDQKYLVVSLSGGYPTGYFKRIRASTVDVPTEVTEAAVTVQTSVGAVRLAYSPDGNEVAVSGQSSKIQTWKFGSSIDTIDASVSSLDYSPNGDLVAAGSDEKVYIFGSRYETVDVGFRMGQGAIGNILACSPNGKYMAVGVKSLLKIYSSSISGSYTLENNILLTPDEENGANSVVFGGDSSYVAAGFGQLFSPNPPGVVTIWHAPDWKQSKTIDACTDDGVRVTSMSAGGDKLAVLCSNIDNQYIHVYQYSGSRKVSSSRRLAGRSKDLGDGWIHHSVIKPIDSYEAIEALECLAISPDGKRLAYGSSVTARIVGDVAFTYSVKVLDL